MYIWPRLASHQKRERQFGVLQSCNSTFRPELDCGVLRQTQHNSRDAEGFARGPRHGC